ncbi:unnamed protein product [Urochloa humidicola]
MPPSLSHPFESEPNWCRRQIIELQVLDALPTRSTKCLAALLDFRDPGIHRPPARHCAFPCDGISGTSMLTSTNLTI